MTSPQSPRSDEAPAPGEKPVGRRAERREERRDAILAVAQAHFLEHGYAATTMSAIAAALGGSKATLWSYFRSKEELFAAVVDRASAQFRESLGAALSFDVVIGDALAAYLRAFLGKVTSFEAISLHRIVAGESGRSPELGLIVAERAVGRGRAQLAAFIAEAMARGLLREGDPHDAAISLMGLGMAGTHQGLVFGRLQQPEPALIEADVVRALDIWLRAYAV